MESAARPNASHGDDCGRLLKRRTREMFRVYPKALVGDVDAVHDLRVAARRLRSALSLLADKPDGRRARRADKTLRDLARAAGRGRDLDVGLEILEAAPRVADDDKLRRSLRASRSRARVLSREALLDLDVAHLRRDLRALTGSTHVDRAAFAARHDALKRSEGETMERDLASGRDGRHPEALHSARRSARRLRYAAELAGLLEGSESQEADRWRGVQTRLGKIQDRRVLGDWLAAREARATAHGDRSLAEASARAASRVKREGARLTRAYFSAPSRSGGPTLLPETPA